MHKAGSAGRVRAAAPCQTGPRTPCAQRRQRRARQGGRAHRPRGQHGLHARERRLPVCGEGAAGRGQALGRCRRGRRRQMQPARQQLQGAPPRLAWTHTAVPSLLKGGLETGVSIAEDPQFPVTLNPKTGVLHAAGILGRGARQVLADGRAPLQPHRVPERRAAAQPGHRRPVRLQGPQQLPGGFSPPFLPP